MNETYNILRPFNFHGKKVKPGDDPLTLDDDEAKALVQAGVVAPSDAEQTEASE